MKKVYRQIVFRTGQQEALKVKDDFVIYWDKTLKRHEVLSADVPHYFEMRYDDEIEVSMKAIGNYGFDSVKREFLPGYKEEDVPKDLLLRQLCYKRFKELLVLIYVLTDKFFFQYEHKQGWFIEMKEGNKPRKNMRLQYGQLFYSSRKPTPKRLKNFPRGHEFHLDPPIFWISDENDTSQKAIRLSDMLVGFYRPLRLTSPFKPD